MVQSSLPNSTASEYTMTETESPISLPSQEATELDRRKKVLEIEKLELEVKAVKDGNVWWRKTIREVKVSEWITAIVAIVALATAFSTGLFDAIRERLIAQGERLSIEKLNLEQQRKRLDEEISSKESQLDEIRTKLSPYRLEESAITGLKNLKSKLIDVRFSIGAENDGYLVEITGRDEKLNWNLIEPRVSRVNPHVSEAIRLTSQLRSLKGVRIDGVQIDQNDIQILMTHPEIERIVLDNNAAGQDILKTLRKFPKLKYLRIDNNPIISINECGSLPQIELLHFSNANITDDGLANIANAFPNLTSLHLGNLRITDKGLKHIGALPKLSSMTVLGTEVTADGLIDFLSKKQEFTLRIRESTDSKRLQMAVKNLETKSIYVHEMTSVELVKNAFTEW